jgi:hypothetical protein
MQWKVRKSIRRLIKSIKGWKKAKMGTDDLTNTKQDAEIESFIFPGSQANGKS